MCKITWSVFMHRYKLANLSTIMVTGSVLPANPTINVSGKITRPRVMREW